jgi:NTP pyrophosphatase (non-canonical NTP hydrolase)
MEKTIYYLYHIPGKKIGVTRDLKYRLTKRQGYQTEEYEVLDSSEDIGYISERELELQLIYGYDVDIHSYKNLINKKESEMKLNVTENTVTFPCPLNKLKGNLFDNLGTQIETNFGSYTLTPEVAEWIVRNANVSMFNPDRVYVYNKALDVFSKTLGVTKTESKHKDPNNVYDLIRLWADERGIYKTGDLKTQYVKLQEESGELAQAILKNNATDFVDAIGDCVVVLTNLAAMEGLRIEDCVASAYNQIKDRKGKMTNGTFVKEQPQTQNGVLPGFGGALNKHVQSTL